MAVTITGERTRCPNCRAYITDGLACQVCRQIQHEKVKVDITSVVFGDGDRVSILLEGKVYHAPKKAKHQDLYRITAIQPFSNNTFGKKRKLTQELCNTHFSTAKVVSVAFTLPNISTWKRRSEGVFSYTSQFSVYHTYNIQSEVYKFKSETRPVSLEARISKGLVQNVTGSSDLLKKTSFTDWIEEQNKSIEFAESVDLFMGDPHDINDLVLNGTIFQWYLWQKLSYPAPYVVKDFPTPDIDINYQPTFAITINSSKEQFDEWERSHFHTLDKIGKLWLGPLGSRHEIVDFVREVLDDALGIKFQLTLEELLLTPKDGIYLKRK